MNQSFSSHPDPRISTVSEEQLITAWSAFHDLYQSGNGAEGLESLALHAKDLPSNAAISIQTRIEVLETLASGYFEHGDFANAERALLDAIAILKKESLLDTRYSSFVNLYAETLIARGEIEDALLYLHTELNRCKQIGDIKGALHCYRGLTAVHVHEGDLDQLETLIDDEIETLAEHDPLQIDPLFIKAGIYADRLALDDALIVATRAWNIALEHGPTLAQCNRMTRLYIMLERFQDAAHILRDGLSHVERLLEPLAERQTEALELIQECIETLTYSALLGAIYDVKPEETERAIIDAAALPELSPESTTSSLSLLQMLYRYYSSKPEAQAQTLSAVQRLIQFLS